MEQPQVARQWSWARVVLILLAVAWLPVVRLVAPPSETAVPTGSSGPSPTTSVTASGDPTAQPPALLTEGGVPVRVIGRSSSGFLVATPCGRRATVSGGTPLFGATVVIDPGHGGAVDTGAVQNGLIEADLNMAVAEATADLLRARGVLVVLTRTFDYGTVLSVRADLADALQARLMVSIHHNSAPAAPPTSALPGTEVFVQDSPESRRLGGLLYQSVTATLASGWDLSWYRSPNAGVLRVTQPDGAETYGILRHPITPTALIEMGWLLNPVEVAEVFRSSTYVPLAAHALADAVEAYLAGAAPAVEVGHRTHTAGLAPGTDHCTDPPLDD
jgi:N-acetylmuramoyl-L-alanine amidase